MPNDACLKRRLLFASVQAYHPGDLDSAPAIRSGKERRCQYRGRARPSCFRHGPNRRSISLWSAALPRGSWSRFAARCRRSISRRTARRSPIGTFGPARAARLAEQFARGLPGAAIGGVRIPGAVHRGFAASLAGLWPGVAAAIDQLRGADAHPISTLPGTAKAARSPTSQPCARDRPGRGQRSRQRRSAHLAPATMTLRENIRRPHRLPPLRGGRGRRAGYPHGRFRHGGLAEPPAASR